MRWRVGMSLIAILAVSTATIFGGCGQPSRLTVDDCLVALENEDPLVQLGALELLYQFGPEAAPAARRVVLLLASPDCTLASGAARVLGAIGPSAAEVAVPELRLALADMRDCHIFGPVWASAAEALGRMGPRGVDVLLELLAENNDAHLVRAAAYGLHFSGNYGQKAVPALIRLLSRNDPNNRKEAIFALQGIGPAAKEAVPILMTMLDSDDFHTQYWACRALGAIGAEAEEAIPVLIRLTTKGVTSVRRNAAAALGRIGPKIGPEGVAALLAALHDPMEAVREQAVIALGRLGSYAIEAVPALEQAVVQRTLQCRPQAALAIWQITGQPEFAIRVIREEIFLPENQLEAISCLKELGPQAAPMAPELVKLLQSSDPGLREAAAEVIECVGPAGISAVPVLQQLLMDRDPHVRKAAARALRALGQPVPEWTDIPVSNL